MAKRIPANVKRFCDELAVLTGEHGDMCNEIGQAALALLAYRFADPVTADSNMMAMRELLHPALTPGRAKKIAKMRSAK